MNDPELYGMATTVVAAYFDHDDLYVINVGDSRAYKISDDVITQLSEDHSYVNELIKAGEITEEEARSHPKKNVITRAIGVDSSTEPDFFKVDVKDGDCILLCSDGLHGELTNDVIKDIVLSTGDSNKACKKLVKMANNHGGSDNVTVVLLKVKRK